MADAIFLISTLNCMNKTTEYIKHNFSLLPVIFSQPLISSDDANLFSNFPCRFELSGIDCIYVEVNKISYKIHRFQRLYYNICYSIQLEIHVKLRTHARDSHPLIQMEPCFLTCNTVWKEILLKTQITRLSFRKMFLLPMINY